MKPEMEKAEALFQEWRKVNIRADLEQAGALRRTRVARSAYLTGWKAGATHERKRRRDTIAPFNLDSMAEGLHALAEGRKRKSMPSITLQAAACLVERLRSEEKP